MYGYIYITTNLINGKQYIGQKASSEFLGTKYLGSGKLLKRAVAKYGSENFKVELLEECNSQDELSDSEIKWIAHYDAVNSDKFYNLQAGGRKGNIKGSKLSEETCKKLSLARRGSNNYWYGKGYLLSGSLNPNYGNHKLKGTKFTEEHKQKISESMKGKGHFISEETKLKISQALSGDNNHNYGKHWYTDGVTEVLITEDDFYNHYEKLGYYRGKKAVTDETRDKISKSKMSHEVSSETRKKISNFAKERFKIPENNPMYGKKHSDKSRNKISRALMGGVLVFDNIEFESAKDLAAYLLVTYQISIPLKTLKDIANGANIKKYSFVVERISKRKD